MNFFDKSLRQLACWRAILAACCLLFFSSVARAETTNIISNIEISAKGGVTRFWAEIADQTDFAITQLKNPERVVIDMANVQFDLPPGIGRKKRGLIRQVRYGILEKGKSRIVIDTAGAVTIKSSQVLPKKGDGKPRIMLELVATNDQQAGAIETNGVSAASPEVTASLPLLVPKAVPENAPNKIDGRKVIVIDPGHGGIDPGAISPNKTKEKDVVFAFATELQRSLALNGNYDVRLTRTQDRFMTLTERVAFSKRSQADLFIAIHADTVRGQTVTGTTIYTLSDKASDEEAEALALKENRADAIAGINLAEQQGEIADVLIDLVQRESKTHANLFSRAALEQLKGVTTMTGKPLRSAGFVVLKVPDVPSVLIELGYLSSRDDEKKLVDPVWQNKMATALAKSIDSHFSMMDAAE